MNTRMIARYSEAFLVAAHAKRRVTTLLVDADHDRYLRVNASRFSLHDRWRKSPLLESSSNVRIKDRIAAFQVVVYENSFLIDSRLYANCYGRALHLRNDGIG